MGARNKWAVGAASMLVVALAFAACSDDHENSSSNAAGMAGEQHAGRSSQAGSESAGGGEPGEGGRSSAQGGSSGGQAGAPLTDAGQGGSGGTPDESCAGGQANWWSSVTRSCHECPVKATVECDEIVAGASYDVDSSTLTVQLPAGRAQVVSASLGVTFNYANGDPEQYADVNAAVAGDTLTFDFSAYGGSQISYLSGEPTIYDACGDYIVVHASGFGFGPAIMIQVPHEQGQGGAANGLDPQIDCGKTN